MSIHTCTCHCMYKHLTYPIILNVTRERAELVVLRNLQAKTILQWSEKRLASLRATCMEQWLEHKTNCSAEHLVSCMCSMYVPIIQQSQISLSNVYSTVCMPA